MAIRHTRFQIKNNQNSAAPFSGSTLLVGEPIVNTAAGIMMFSGVTTGTNDWTPAGVGGNANFFEVGSNLYDLRLRNRLTQYEGQSGSNLIGKFLSGTTNGFVLADISDIAASVDSYTTGVTWNPNVLTINLNNGKPSVSTTIDSFTGLTINGNLFVTGTETVNNLTITGTGLYNTVANGSNPSEIVNYSSLTGFNITNDVYVTGSTLTSANDNTNSQSSQLSYHGTPIGGPYTIDTENTYITGGTISYTGPNGVLSLDRNDSNTVTVVGFSDIFTTGATLIGSSAYFDTNQSLSAYTLDLSALDTNDTYVTGFTYNPVNNTFTISQNEGEAPLTASIDTVSGLTVSNLTQGRVVYVGTSGLLTDKSIFTYDDNTDILNVANIETSGDITIQGNLTVLGSSVSAFTSQLYVEDPNVIFNYNPTGSTTVTSVNAGLTIQDGNGISSGDVNFDIVRLQNLTGLTANQVPSVAEYTSATGFANRGWITQLNDIVIRSTDVTDGGTAGDFNGVRVLAEFDVLDGGTY